MPRKIKLRNITETHARMPSDGVCEYAVLVQPKCDYVAVEYANDEKQQKLNYVCCALEYTLHIHILTNMTVKTLLHSKLTVALFLMGAKKTWDGGDKIKMNKKRKEKRNKTIQTR